MKQATIDFRYAFQAPHSLTLCRPSASRKIVADVSEGGIRFFCATGSLKNIDPLSWVVLPQDVQFAMSVSVDGHEAKLSEWRRHESGAPFLLAEGAERDVHYSVSAIAAASGLIVKTAVFNTGAEKRDCHIQFAHTTGWVISNKGWIDGIHSHVLMTMNDGRADRLLVCAYGAQDYPIYKNGAEGESLPPMANEKFGIKPNSMKKITAHDTLDPSETKIGYFFLPYEKYFDDLAGIDPNGFEAEMTEALEEWLSLLAKGTEIRIADEKLMHCYRACVADLFVMREPIGERMGISCGTRFYRSANSGESLESTVLLETIGYTEEAQNDYPLYLDGQDADGCWVTSRGWEHDVWSLIYNKANAVTEHYYMTGDLGFLEAYYPRMYASSMFNSRARATTKHSPVISERGLMPRGMGDCGMMNGGDYYGVFYPHNILAVAADFKTLEAAKILGREEDVLRLTRLCEEAKRDLMASIRANLAEVNGCRIVPSVAGMPLTSLYGCLYAFFPAGFLSQDDPIVRDTVRLIETGRQSVGGLPIGMGWMRDGLWVAMALGNVARAYLRMGASADPSKYLYPALNHASPFVTWCEERGAEAGASKISGDRQHLWTPLSVCQYLTEALFHEDGDAVHVCAGIAPEWLSKGKEICVKGFRSHYGKTDFSVKHTDDGYHFSIRTERTIQKEIWVHLPSGIRKYKNETP
ncbi:MAG: hypothetical protein IKM00_00315 [Clostridia bacterium]|nr:hypothetical protein [Clostridia bacterium]